MAEDEASGLLSAVFRWESYTALLTALAREREDMRLRLIPSIQEGERALSAALAESERMFK